MRIDIYSDTVCPWCYLGKRRFEAALALRPQYEPRVVFRPFELNPDLPVEGVERAWFLSTRITSLDRFKEGERTLVELGLAVGIEFRFDLIERVPNTRRSHLLLALAARRGLQSAVKERLLRAYFQEGRDIGDLDELVRLGVEAGLAEGETRIALALRAGQDAVVAAERHASALGLTGVPAFIFNGEYALSGAQAPAALADAMDQVAGIAAAREA